MTKEEKVEKFAKELDFIGTPRIKQAGEILVGKIPDYFFEVAASSTGKYHPKISLGKGGLLRHTKAAVRFAYWQLSLEMFDKYSQEEKDLMILALIMHDSRKHGESIEQNKFTVTEHPVIAANAVEIDADIKGLLSEEEITLMSGCILTHMGQWNTDRYKREFAPKPFTKHQNFVHLCDYLASRKSNNMEFDENDEIIE